MQVKKAKKMQSLDRQIHQLQQQLSAVGPMRPGTLTRQYRKPLQRRWGYYQLSYTFQSQSRTEYVRPGELAEVGQELANYGRFRQLTARWVALALQRARLRLELGRAAVAGQAKAASRARMLPAKMRKTAQTRSHAPKKP